VSERSRVRVRGGEQRCPYCHDEIGQTLDRTACQNCEAWHHSECWSGHGGCSSCGYVRPGDAARAPVLRRQAVRRPRGHVCSIPGCGGALPSAVAVPRLCLGHAEEARLRNASQRLPKGTLLVLAAAGLPGAVAVALGLAGAAAGLPRPLVFALPVAGAVLSLVGFALVLRRAHAHRTSGRSTLSGVTPSPDYEPASADTPSPDYPDR
jgi:hypothetical protein